MIGFVIFVVLLLTLVLGQLDATSLAIYIVVLLIAHVFTIGMFLSKLIAIYRESGRSYDRSLSLNNLNPTNDPMATANAASPRSTRGNSGRGQSFVESGSPKPSEVERTSLVAVSTVSLLAAPVTTLIRMATLLTITLCVHTAFVIWFSAVFDDEDSYPVIATLMYYASTADVFMNFMAAMLLHEAMDKELHFCVRSVPHGFMHPLQAHADAVRREKERKAAEEQAEAMGFHITNSTRDVIIQYEEKKQSPQLDDDLDRYTMTTIEDHASYHRDEKQLEMMMEDELNKKSRSPDDENRL